MIKNKKLHQIYSMDPLLIELKQIAAKHEANIEALIMAHQVGQIDFVSYKEKYNLLTSEFANLVVFKLITE